MPPTGDDPYLSSNKIPVRQRLIHALDVPTHDEALAIVAELGDAVEFYKLGLQLFLSGDYFRLASRLRDQDKRIFVDLKFFDIPKTVASAVRNLNRLQADFATVHGNENMLRAACEARQGTKILAVTVLTSLDRDDLRDMGLPADREVADLVLSRTRRALEVGCDGVISSAREAAALRRQFHDRFLIVAPGIRPVDNELVADDQKRTTDVRAAFQQGADYIVVGRPIRNAGDRRAAAERIQGQIAEVFAAAGDA